VVVNSSSSVTFLDSVGNTATDFPAPFTAADFANAQAGPSATVLSLIPSYTPSLPHGPNAVWIGTNVSAGIAAGDTALYAASFTLPSGVSSASLTLYYAVDNGLGHTNPGIYINGTALPNSTVPSSSCVATGCAFLQEQIYTDANIGPLLVSGTNWIYFDAVNLGGPGGLIFSAVITYGASTGTPAAAAGYAVSNFATGFPNSGPGGVGPIGLAFDALGNLYVTDYLTGILYKFPPNGGVASAATQVNTVPIPGYPAGLAFAKDGSLFCARQQTGDVVQLDPSTGAILRTVATIPFATGIATDPLTGDLFVSDPALPSNSVFRVSNFANTTSPGTVAIYASVAGPDGLSFGADGSLYTAALEVAEIAKIAGTNSPVAGQVTYLNAAIPSLDGMAMSANPNAQFLYTNRNNGIITKADLSTTPPAAAVIS
jgi:sugar lactone lactonase YvrE